MSSLNSASRAAAPRPTRPQRTHATMGATTRPVARGRWVALVAWFVLFVAAALSAPDYDAMHGRCGAAGACAVPVPTPLVPDRGTVALVGATPETSEGAQGAAGQAAAHLDPVHPR